MRGDYGIARIRENKPVKVTIRHVAKHAGVSPATVSRVMNRPEMVDPQTKERVRESIKALDFQPNAMARGLSIERTQTIGLLVPGIQDFFFDELYLGIEQEARAHGMKVLLYDAQYSRSAALEGFGFLSQHRVDGLIFTSKLVDEDYDAVIERLGIPVVLTLTESFGRLPITSFKTDDVRAIFDVIAYLVARGHRRIGFIGGQPDDVAGVQRLEGYRQGLSHYGIPYQEEFVAYGNFRFDSGYKAMKELLGRQTTRTTAVIAAGDEMAIGAIHCLRDAGLRVPDDMSVVGFDDLRIARMTIPRLTTVAQPFVEIGANAVRAILQMIDNEKLPRMTGVHYLPYTIVERESVRAIAADAKD